MHRNDADEGRRQHQVRIGICLASRCDPLQEPRRHHLGHSCGEWGQPEGINRKAVAELLDLTPVDPNPSVATTLYVRIRIDFGVRCGTDFHDLFSIGLCSEKKESDVWLLAGQATQLVDELRRYRFARVVRTAIRMAP